MLLQVLSQGPLFKLLVLLGFLALIKPYRIFQSIVVHVVLY
jgi:hypothetical protein